jgi:hypothetical protein
MNTDDNVTNKKITYVVPMNLCCKGSVMGGVSLLRMQESSFEKLSCWIPAFAGMTSALNTTP